MSDKLVRDIHRCSKHHVGEGYYVLCDSKIHRLHKAHEMTALLKANKGRRLRYRCSGFAGGTHWKMAAVIY